MFGAHVKSYSMSQEREKGTGRGQTLWNDLRSSTFHFWCVRVGGGLGWDRGRAGLRSQASRGQVCAPKRGLEKGPGDWLGEQGLTEWEERTKWTQFPWWRAGMALKMPRSG